MAGGEKVSQGSLEPLFQVRILARQPRIRARVETHVESLASLERQAKVSSDLPPQLADDVAAVILAAGLGTRMRSKIAKELQPVAGRPMLSYVLGAAGSINPRQIIVVLSPPKAPIVETLPPHVQVAWQDEPLGTGHATAQALPLLEPSIKRVAVLFGDHPLLTAEAVRQLIQASHEADALVTLLTAVLPDPGAYGRVWREGGRITGIVEAKEDPTTYSAPVEIYSGISCYQRDWLEATLPLVPRSAVGEYYLTTLVERASRESRRSEPVATVVAEAETAYGINDRVELAVAERIVRARINERLMRSGVTIVDPGSVFIDADVEIGPDSRIEPFTTIEGQSVIGSGCRIGPQSIIRDSHIGNDCEVVASMLEGASVGDRVHIGPYSHFRSGADVASDAHIGNYVEIKNSTVGEETHIGHFSYVGDSQLGRRVNIGAGTITANYDGKDKHQTIIGDDAFIGSDTILRAPVEVGEGSRTGAGSVVTKDVAPGATVVGIPARPIGSGRRRRTGPSEQEGKGKE